MGWKAAGLDLKRKRGWSDCSGRRRYGFALAAVLLLGGCGTLPPLRTMACQSAPPARVSLSPDGRTERATLSVLTYNIEGLGWPARSGRAAQLREIGARLSAMRAAGTAPDIVMVQEMFSGPAKKAIMATGYPAIAAGPRRTTRQSKSTRERLPGRSQLLLGELGIHLTGGGLAIASRYPIVQVATRAYGRRSCAGKDCLANKGIMLARIAMPGVPVPIDLYNTHMNSRGASGASPERSLAAHGRQAQEASEFMLDTHEDRYPLVLGGDFNMRHSEERWENFAIQHALSVVHRDCAQPDSGCDVRLSWDNDEPWMDTQDLQLFWQGQTVAIRPMRVEAMFDGGASGPRLSDHDGFLVTYELSWPAGTPVVSGC